MKLNEVIDLLKEITEKCPRLDGNDFLIAPSKLPHSSVDGYQVHITGKFEDETRTCLNSIAIKRKLAIRMETDSVMIYNKKNL